MRHEGIAERVEASRRRLGMMPEPLRKRVVTARLWPVGTRWCAGCQSFVDLVDVGKGASQCKACVSATSHGAMIAKTYGITSLDYDSLLALQGGRCAICRQRPGKIRLAVDHDHKSGAVRGLLCGRDNHDLLGAGYDSVDKLQAAVDYLKTPPAFGQWIAPELSPRWDESSAQRPPKPLDPLGEGFATPSDNGRERPQSGPALDVFGTVLPAGWETKEPAELHAIWRELNGLLQRVDPPPF